MSERNKRIRSNVPASQATVDILHDILFEIKKTNELLSSMESVKKVGQPKKEVK